MSALAVWLVALGAGDLVRAIAPTRRWWLGPGTATTLAITLVLLAGLTAVPDLLLLVITIAGLIAWGVLSERSLRTGRGHLAALAVAVAPAAIALGFSGALSPVAGPIATWLGWSALPLVHGVDPGRVLLLAGLFVVNLATGNVIVRLVLVATGALRAPADSADQSDDQLKGGRLLGPMERVFILGLGLAGEMTAASMVIAAKGLLRFPELQAKRNAPQAPGPGIDEVTEYFLVGSFVSWLVALLSLALTR